LIIPVAQKGGMLICLVLFAGGLVACGDDENATRSGERQEPVQEGEKRSAEIPSVDRTAFYEIATVSGSLRLSAAPVALGQANRQHGTEELVTARHRLAALRPRDPQLARLTAKLRAALAVAIRPVHGLGAVRQAARRALHATDVINAGLRSYAARHPATAALIPE
jgi:hypothetical protein